MADSPDSATRSQSEPGVEVLDKLPDDYLPSVTSKGGGFKSGWVASVDQLDTISDDDEDAYKPWLRGIARGKHDPSWEHGSQETFGPESLSAVDIERAAMEEVPDDRTEEETSSDEAEKGEANDSELEFQHRLFENHAASQVHPFRPTSLWPRSSIIDQHAAMIETFRREQDEPFHERRRSARLSDLQNRDSHRHGTIGREGYSGMEAQHNDPHEWLYLRGPAGLDGREGTEEVETGLELLGEDGSPYVFEPVGTVDLGRQGSENQQAASASHPSGSDAGATLDASENPFLQKDPAAQAVSVPTSTLQTFDEVAVVYNLPSANNGEQGCPRVEAFQEEDILREVADYLNDLSRAFAAARVGTTGAESPDAEIGNSCRE